MFSLISIFPSFLFQSILAGHSEFLNNLLSRFHSVEFSIGDWQYGEMFLLDRRKSYEPIRVSLPDMEMRHVSLMLDLFSTGAVTLESPQEAKILKDLWKLFKIDSIRLDALEVISEVNLLQASSKSGKNSVMPNHFIKLQDIKKEIVDENDEFLSFRSELEIECDLCRETFQAEDDLMRHVDHIHQTSRSMYDRIKYKRSKEKEENDRHPKGKGKGKGKKSIESKPVRKEVLPEPETIVERPLTPTVVDSSNSNSLDDVPNVIIEDDIHISDNEITFKSFSDQVESENTDSRGSSDSKESDSKFKKRINLEKK